MHEWALAEAVIMSTLRIAKERGLREIREVVIKVGELQQIDVEIFKFALSELKKENNMENVEFKIEIDEAEMMCRKCGYKWKFRSEGLSEDVKEAIHFIPEVAHTFMRCPKCGSPDFEVISGRGVWIESISGVA
ncbi:MAG: hydrogenase nickel incorporation protein HypA [archaeon YNP-WB-062]|jgi:hydrogenase nickel incorporation protein HypA/HybF|nr:hydrogenase nickel incorporation protein HypA [Candidatus Culexarchaeum yellowstonense]